MDVVILARIQFALTIGFHFLFPPLSIGLAYFLSIIEGIAFFKKDSSFTKMGKFFGNIFALIFAVGVGSGIVMSFQFGTNWGEFTKIVNNVFGSFLAIEIIFAFFIESAFLGIYLFARNRVPGWLHFLSIILVTVGTTCSAFFILSANSWMQTPSGFEIKSGIVMLTNFWQAMFNPSFLYRFFHTIIAALLSGAFLICGILSYLILKNKSADISKKILKVVIIVTFIISLLQIFPAGHQQIVEVDRNQKEKMATIEGVYESTNHAAFVIFIFPINNPPYFIKVIEIPGFLSFMFDLSGDHYITGLKDVPAENIPPVALTFIAFHTMVYIGVAMIFIMGLCTFLIIKKKLFASRLFMRVLIFSIPLPILATQLGWITSEAGRQPWIVYKVLKTVNAVSISVPAWQILFSIFLICFVYLIILAIFIYLMIKTINKGPES